MGVFFGIPAFESRRRHLAKALNKNVVGRDVKNKPKTEVHVLVVG